MYNGLSDFSVSGGARNAVAYANPLTPGGLNARNTHLPTLTWAIGFVAVAFLVYHFAIKK